MIAAGTRAPEFALRNQDGEKISLAELRGSRVLLIFYPADFSPVCNDQLSVYQEVLGDFEAKNVKPIGISVDGAFCHRAFADKLATTIPLLSDFNPRGAVAASYGAFLEQRGHTNRSLVLIDPDGVVAWSHQGPILEVPGANLIFDAIEALDGGPASSPG